MTKQQPKTVDQEIAVITKGQNRLVYCPNCHDYTLHRKIGTHPNHSICQCHICGNRLKLVKNPKRKTSKN